MHGYGSKHIYPVINRGTHNNTDPRAHHDHPQTTERLGFSIMARIFHLTKSVSIYVLII